MHSKEDRLQQGLQDGGAFIGRQLLVIFTFVLAVWSSAVSASSATMLRIVHTPLHFVSEQVRSSIFFSVSSSEHLKEARCYFKGSLDQQWVFSRAEFIGINQFTCESPILADEVEWLDYRILIVGDDDNVIRSNLFRAPVVSTEHNVAAKLSPKSLELFDELSGTYQPWIADPGASISAFTKENERYGLIAGFYSELEIPVWFAVKAGYFGGFEYDQVLLNIFAVKGFASGLSKVGFDLRLSARPLFIKPKASTPNIDGNDWSGFFETTGFNNRQNLTSDIDQSGGHVTLTTSKSGLAHRFIGTINSNGDMLVFDQSDGEDWTTHLGPASDGAISLYDFIRPPTAQDPNPPLNSVILRRELIPNIPSSINASDGSSKDKINISWAGVPNTNFYLVYRCQSASSSSCSLFKNTANQFTSDKPVDRRIYYYRVRACNSAGCSEFSAADTGYLRAVNTVGLMKLLLLD